MVCEVCSVDHDDDGGEPIILDYPRFKAVQKPCPNCGTVHARTLTLSSLTAVTAARRRASGFVSPAFPLSR